MKITVGIGLWSLQQLSFLQHMGTERILECVKELGADAVDIYEDYIPCNPHVRLHELYSLRKKTEDLGLLVKGCWFCMDIATVIEAAGMQRALYDFKEYLAVCHVLGAEYICIPYLDNIPGKTLDDGKESLVRFFENVLPCAEKYKIKIAHELPRQGTPGAALDILNRLKSRYYTLCPDLEAWRQRTDDLPLVHAENPDAKTIKPESIEMFRECLPYSPYIHFKMIGFDEQGNEPHFPMDEIMDAIEESKEEHHLCIEYEGWIPDIRPDIDCVEATKKCIDLIRRYENKYKKRREA